MSLVFKTLRWGALLCSLILLTTAFVPSTEASSKDLSCTVEVRNADGSAAKYAKVSTDVSGGVFCAGGRTFEANANGKVTLYWGDGCKLTAVFVKGDKYKVDYQDGGSYTLTLK